MAASAYQRGGISKISSGEASSINSESGMAAWQMAAWRKWRRNGIEI